MLRLFSNQTNTFILNREQNESDIGKISSDSLSKYGKINCCVVNDITVTVVGEYVKYKNIKVFIFTTIFHFIGIYLRHLLERGKFM